MRLAMRLAPLAMLLAMLLAMRFCLAMRLAMRLAPLAMLLAMLLAMRLSLAMLLAMRLAVRVLPATCVLPRCLPLLPLCCHCVAIAVVVHIQAPGLDQRPQARGARRRRPWEAQRAHAGRRTAVHCVRCLGARAVETLHQPHALWFQQGSQSALGGERRQAQEEGLALCTRPRCCQCSDAWHRGRGFEPDPAAGAGGFRTRRAQGAQRTLHRRPRWSDSMLLALLRAGLPCVLPCFVGACHASCHASMFLPCVLPCQLLSCHAYCHASCHASDPSCHGSCHASFHASCVLPCVLPCQLLSCHASCHASVCLAMP